MRCKNFPRLAVKALSEMRLISSKQRFLFQANEDAWNRNLCLTHANLYYQYRLFRQVLADQEVALADPTEKLRFLDSFAFPFVDKL